MKQAENHPGFLHMHPLKGGKATWLHMSVDSPQTSDFLMEDVNLNDHTVEALLEEDTRWTCRVLVPHPVLV